MKKIKKKFSRKKLSKNKKIKKVHSKKKLFNIKKNKKKNFNKRLSKKKILKKSNFKKTESLIFKIIELQNSLSSVFKINFDFSLEKQIQKFFDTISNTITNYQILKAEDKRKRKLDEIEKKERERIFLQKKKLQDEEFQTRLKQKVLKEEAKLERERK